jgi:Protein of unknown function (DUF2637)
MHRPTGGSRMDHARLSQLTTGALAGSAFIGSFGHVQRVAATHGQAGWMSWAIAVSIELMALTSAVEIRGRRKERLPYKGPVATLALGVAMSLACNLACAQPDTWGFVVSAWPAVAFTAVALVVETRPSAHVNAVRVEASVRNAPATQPPSARPPATRTQVTRTERPQLTAEVGPRPVRTEGASRTDIECELVEQMRATPAWRPDYADLEAQTKRSRSWCEKRVLAARRLARQPVVVPGELTQSHVEG